jgi:hypothetical protein
VFDGVQDVLNLDPVSSGRLVDLHVLNIVSRNSGLPPSQFGRAS